MQNFIEIAISVILLFLIVSVVVTAINEIIARLLRLRGAILYDGIKAILDNDDLRQNFYASGVIFSVAQSRVPPKPEGKTRHSVFRMVLGLTDRTGHPSYIASENFAKALIQAVVRPSDGNVAVKTFEDIQSAVGNLPKGRIKDVLVSSLNEGVTDVKALETSIANWYDTAAQRLSGRYKRWQQVITLFVGLALAVGLNIDTLKFISSVRADDALRARIVEQAVEIAGKDDAFGKCDADGQAEAGSEEEDTAPPPADQQAAVEEIKCYTAQMSDALGQLDALAIGWTEYSWKAFTANWTLAWRAVAPGDETGAGAATVSADGGSIAFLVYTFVGWLITALAVTLGAPFWFDLLKTFVNIRSAGQPPKPKNDSQGGSAAGGTTA